MHPLAVSRALVDDAGACKAAVPPAVERWAEERLAPVLLGPPAHPPPDRDDRFAVQLERGLRVEVPPCGDERWAMVSVAARSSSLKRAGQSR